MNAPRSATLAALPLIILALGGAAGCKKKGNPTAPVVEADRRVEADTPVLAVSPGHRWTYEVSIENPHDSRSGGLVSGKFERVRKYLGKVDPGNGQPAADCFEVSSVGAKTRREFVNIAPGEIQLLGQAEIDETGKQVGFAWLDQPIPFFKAGLLAGDSMPVTVLNKDKDLWRVTRVIAREKVFVPAGEFDAVRLQMFGNDGKISLRKTYWFTPGKGIIREEKVREVDGKPVMLETEELKESSPGT